MSGFTVPVSMLVPKGNGGVIAIGVISLMIVLALAASRDPTTANSSAKR